MTMYSNLIFMCAITQKYLSGSTEAKGIGKLILDLLSSVALCITALHSL